MSDRAILTIFFSMCIGTMAGEMLNQVLLPAEEVQVEIYFEQPPLEEEINIYIEEQKPRCI